MESARQFMQDMKQLMECHLSALHSTSNNLPESDNTINLLRRDQRMQFARELQMRTRILGDRCIEDELDALKVNRTGIDNAEVANDYLSEFRQTLEEYDRILRRTYLGGELKELILTQRNAMRHWVLELEEISV